jgi:hypothetical protein
MTVKIKDRIFYNVQSCVFPGIFCRFSRYDREFFCLAIKIKDTEDHHQNTRNNPDRDPPRKITDPWIPDGKKFGSGSRIRNLFDPKSRIRDAKFRIRGKHPGSATLTDTQVCFFSMPNTYFQRFADHFYLLSGRRSSGQQGQSLIRRRRRWWHSPPSPARSTPPFPSGNVS